MTLNASGPISLAGTTVGVSIENELGGNGTTQISLNDASVRGLAGVPSGAITMPTNFWGKSSYVYGSTWTYQSGLLASSWPYTSTANAIAWSGSKYCVVGTAGACATSPDGVTWTANSGLSSLIGTINVASVCWGNSQFIAGAATGHLATSSDGVTWTNRTSNLTACGWPGYSTIDSIIWTGSQYVIVGGSGQCATSPDGVTWTRRTGLAAICGLECRSITYANGYYVAVGNYIVSPGVAQCRAAKSTDAINWTAVTTQNIFPSNGLETWGVAYGNGVWVIVGSNAVVGYSTDLVTFTAGNLNWGTTSNAYNVIWNGSEFIAVGDTGKVSLSTNGTTWTNITTLSATSYGTVATKAIVWGSNKLVVSAYGGTNSAGKVATSP